MTVLAQSVEAGLSFGDLGIVGFGGIVVLAGATLVGNARRDRRARQARMDDRAHDAWLRKVTAERSEAARRDEEQQDRIRGGGEPDPGRDYLTCLHCLAPTGRPCVDLDGNPVRHHAIRSALSKPKTPTVRRAVSDDVYTPAQRAHDFARLNPGVRS